MDFTIYDLSTGKILRTGSCPDSMFEIQRHEGEGIIAGKADDTTQHVVNGKVADFTPQMAADKESEDISRRATMKREQMIRERMDSILRQQAIAELIAEGKIPEGKTAG